MSQELEEQSNALRAQRERLIEVTLERDQLKLELDTALHTSTHTSTHATAHTSTKHGGSSRGDIENITNNNGFGTSGMTEKLGAVEKSGSIEKSGSGILTRNQRKALQELVNKQADPTTTRHTTTSGMTSNNASVNNTIDA